MKDSNIYDKITKVLVRTYEGKKQLINDIEPDSNEFDEFISSNFPKLKSLLPEKRQQSAWDFGSDKSEDESPKEKNEGENDSELEDGEMSIREEDLQNMRPQIPSSDDENNQFENKETFGGQNRNGRNPRGNLAESYDPMNPNFGRRGGKGKFMPNMSNEYRQHL